MNTDAKIDAIYEAANDIKIEVAKCIVRLENQDEKQKDQEARLRILETIKNKGIGVAIIVGTIFGAFIGWIFKHL